jgi:hypothetical protein
MKTRNKMNNLLFALTVVALLVGAMPSAAAPRVQTNGIVIEGVKEAA